VYFADSPNNTYIASVFLVTLLFFQLMFKPFVGTVRNALDGYFLLNLIVLISGSVYFNAVAESNSGMMRQQVLQLQTAISTTIITFGYLGFAVIVVYHIFDRFPKLKNLKPTTNKLVWKLNPSKDSFRNVIHDSVNYGATPTHEPSNDSRKGNSSHVNYTEIREPLLDEGSLDLTPRTV